MQKNRNKHDAYDVEFMFLVGDLSHHFELVKYSFDRRWRLCTIGKRTMKSMIEAYLPDCGVSDLSARRSCVRAAGRACWERKVAE